MSEEDYKNNKINELEMALAYKQEENNVLKEELEMCKCEIMELAKRNCCLEDEMCNLKSELEMCKSQMKN